MNTHARLVILITTLGLMSCSNPLKGLLVTKGTKEKEIAALRTDYEAKMVAVRAQTDVATKAVITAKDTQMSGAADAFYGQGIVFKSILTPTRTDFVFNNLAEEGWTAIGKIQPTAEAMQRMNDRLKKELDATQTTLAQLQQTHEATMVQNQALTDATKKHQAELAVVEASKMAAISEFSGKLDTKQTELIGVQEQVIELEKQRANDRAALQVLKTKMSIVLGILALAGVAGAIYLPVFKHQSAMFGAACGLASIGIWFIQPWMVAAAAGTAVLAVVGSMVLKHAKEEKLGDGLVLSMNRIQEKAPETWANVISPIVKDQLGKYVNVDGKTVVRQDPEMTKLIESKLVAYELHGDPTPTPA